MFTYLSHLIIPRHSNNHKAKLLHSSTLFLIGFCVLLSQLALTIIPRQGVKVLGYAANISIDEVVNLTNQKRRENGVGNLEVSQVLNKAAYLKGQDMLAKNYWAHVSPDGTQPWKFFIDEGYVYRYAGENLARDFSNPTAAVEAWMASPSHRENLLSSKYEEIGIGVVEGDIDGVDTTIVVQFFGTRSAKDKTSVPVAAAYTVDETVVTPTTQPVTPTVSKEKPVVVGDIQNGKTAMNSKSSSYEISPFSATKTISLTILGLLLVVMVVDSAIVLHKKVPRKSGRLIAHLTFLGMIFVIVLIVKAGKIL
ncbi:hypothetical protein IPM62_04890 [Candidatus Woesebacteria bacterium]|nr:MAG: hypothetical protein IPM62_04890 [Candidatus Woesebacteria bacterium]